MDTLTNAANEQNPFDADADTESKFLIAWSKARIPSEKNQDTTLHVLEVALAWEAGEIPLVEARKLARGFDVFVALNQLERGTDQRAVVLKYVSELCEAFDTQTSGLTKHGVWTKKELDEEGALYDKQRIVFPSGREVTGPGQYGAFQYPDLTVIKGGKE